MYVGRAEPGIRGSTDAGRACIPLQPAFHEHHGLRCGYCTPGFLMALLELWPERAEVTREEVDDVLAGQLCRCTGYVGIRRAAYAAFGLEPTR